jgi:hypothetical protein
MGQYQDFHIPLLLTGLCKVYIISECNFTNCFFIKQSVQFNNLNLNLLPANPLICFGFKTVIRAEIQQSNFLPRIGYFHKISMIDSIVFLDDSKVCFFRCQSGFNHFPAIYKYVLIRSSCFPNYIYYDKKLCHSHPFSA